MTPRSFLTALAAFHPLPKQPIYIATSLHFGLSFSTALSMQQRTCCVHQKYQHHGTRGNNIFSCASPTTSFQGRRRTLLQSGKDDNRWEKQDDEPSSRTRRRKRRSDSDVNYTQQTIDDGNIAAQLLESSISFLSQPVPIPFFANRSLPLVYPLSTLLAVAILPPVTGGLLVLSFGVYLSLGTALAGDSVNSGSVIGERKDNQNEYLDEHDEAGEDEGVLPLAAFTGAIASAALLSPQGLASGGESLSLTSPVGLFGLGLGLLTIVLGIKEMGDEEQLWEERERRDGVVRDERRRMDRWDEELEE
eukprot:CAMPEP_0201941892 /NCGR_PEP_ID=MMETSP0903-20130614/47943_1 /ASSEMBLY_ACC=CAM_ASM_000552 /TAXON_ID=420261 /ORGANISM="Thalassiosira antarctica, Strain CCMP982" /LENGTH=304 /DNA_ID=CAMNT_0048484085 /DNA_START=52 /DNA_END=966 /DNA_ORIENTATION=+